jgi:putative DNA primase/helicase
MLKTVRDLLTEAGMEDDNDHRKKLVKWALQCESRSRIEAAVTLAGRLGSQFGTVARPSDFDPDPWMLNTPNGIVDLRSGEIKPHSRDAMCSRITAAHYRPEARSELWARFLERVLPDPEDRAFVQRAAGSSLTGNPREEKLFFAYGPTATGKSTFLRAILAALGDYGMTSDFDTFIARDFTSGSPRNDIARLAGARFVCSIEVEEGKRLAENVVKTLTGRDVVPARFLYREAFEFCPSFTLWLAANNRPHVNADDDAIWRRIGQVPFSVQIPDAERDPSVKERLCDPQESGPTILTWLVEGCLTWQRSGLRIPESVSRATLDYREELDVVGHFLTECCEVRSGLRTRAGDLYQRFLLWAREGGEQAVTAASFKSRLQAKGFRQRRQAHGFDWEGLGIRQ